MRPKRQNRHPPSLASQSSLPSPLPNQSNSDNALPSSVTLQAISHHPTCPLSYHFSDSPPCYTNRQFQAFYTSASAMHGCRPGGGGKVGPGGVAGEGAQGGPGELLAGPDRP